MDFVYNDGLKGFWLQERIGDVIGARVIGRAVARGWVGPSSQSRTEAFTASLEEKVVIIHKDILNQFQDKRREQG